MGLSRLLLIHDSQAQVAYAHVASMTKAIAWDDVGGAFAAKDLALCFRVSHAGLDKADAHTKSAWNELSKEVLNQAETYSDVFASKQ
jgi:hypothetical protein